MAEQTTTEAILNVRVESSNAINSINAYKDKIAELNKQIATLTELQKNEATATAENAKQIEAAKALRSTYSQSVSTLSKEVQNNIKIQKEEEGSLKSLRAQLSNLTSAYDALSQADRENMDVGGKLKEQINDITDTLKGAEEGTQRYYRNVGNYKNAILDTLGANNKYIKGIEMLNEVSSQGAGNAFKVAAEAVKGFGKQLLALLANPIVAIIAAIAAVIMMVVKAIKSSEENTRALQRVIAPFKRLLDAVLNVIQTLVGAILSVVEGFEKMAMKLSRMLEDLPLVGKYFKQLNDEVEKNNALMREQQAIEDAERGYKVQNAKEALKVSELKNKAEQKDKYTAEERIKFLEEANTLEETQMKRSYELAQRKYELAKAQSKQTQNSKEANDELAELEADMYVKQMDYQNKTKENVTKIIALKQEEAAAEKSAADEAKRAAEESKKAAEERKKAIEEALNALKETRRKAEDLIISTMKDAYKREEEETRTALQRQIDDYEAAMKKRNDEASKATGEARQAMLKQIEEMKVTLTEMGVAFDEKMRELAEKQKTEHIQAEIELISKRLEAAREGSEKAYNLQVEQAKKQHELEMRSLVDAKLTEEEKVAQAIAINEAYEEKMRKMWYDRKMAEATFDAQQFNDKIARMQMEGQSEVAVLQEKLDEAQRVRDNMRQLDGESQEQYNARKLAADQAYYNAHKELVAKENQVTQTRLDVASAIAGGLGKVFEQMGEEGTAYAKIGKALALAEIAINTGKAIAAGTAQAQSVPFPANLAAIATTVATVLANVATAISTVKSAKFAEGGLVTGEGTGTSDSIPAMLSNGESVMTAQTTAMFAPLLSAMNQIGGGAPIPVSGSIFGGGGQDALTAALTKAFEQMPSPVVSVQEITDVTNRVRAIEQRATL